MYMLRKFSDIWCQRTLFAWYIWLCVVDVGLLCGDTCKRQAFRLEQDYTYTGDYFVRHGTSTYKQCLRLCRQYLECDHFVMEWFDSTEESGHCLLIRDQLAENLLQYQATNGHSLYGR